MKLQKKRLFSRSIFFLLFILAPIFDIFRFDFNQNHFIILGYSWILGTSDFNAGIISNTQMALNMLWYFFLPFFVIVGGFIFIAYKWGRLYCGWLCPHFSVVEMINALMRRSSGKLSIWDKNPLPENQKDGVKIKPNKNYWFITAFAIVFFAFIWAVVLLTYFLPPKEIYSNLFNLSLTPNQSRFIFVATVLLIIEFSLARHLFCRFGCAVGLFQSLAWMANKKAMAIKFDKTRASECSDCDKSCDNACPMRLKSRANKRHRFTCTQCLECVNACENVQIKNNKKPLLKI